MDQMKAWEKVGIQSGLIKALKPSLNSENSVYKYTGIGVFEERNSSNVSWILQQGIWKNLGSPNKSSDTNCCWNIHNS